MLPVVGSAVQLTENAVDAVAPAVTDTVRGLAPPTVQFDATPESSTELLPAGSPENVTPLLLLLVMDWLVDPSTVTV